MGNIYINSLAPGRCGSKFKSVISEHKLWIALVKLLWDDCQKALAYWL